MLSKGRPLILSAPFPRSGPLYLARHRRHFRLAPGSSLVNRGKAVHQSSPSINRYRADGLDVTSRKRLLQQHRFPEWLSDHLEAYAQHTKDALFAKYLRSFNDALYKRNIYLQSLETDHQAGLTKALKRHEPTEDPIVLFRRLYTTLTSIYAQSGERGVDAHLRYSYEAQNASGHLSRTSHQDQRKLADLRYPLEWYPATRTLQRTIHLHVGPTNSGKTYHALKTLEEAGSGVYAGPLRLLAHEVFQRLNTQGKTCDLSTGDERIIRTADGKPSQMQSGTVEMIPLNKELDVAVVDEIQMIGSDSRGWAWTQALLGLRAK